MTKQTGRRWLLHGGLPYGARETGPTQDGTRAWLTACILGSYIRLMLRPGDHWLLDRPGCERLGLCGECTGYGLLPPSPAQGKGPRACPACGGSGRPAVRLSAGDDGQRVLAVYAHDYVPPRRGTVAACLGCGFTEVAGIYHGRPAYTELALSGEGSYELAAGR